GAEAGNRPVGPRRDQESRRGARLLSAPIVGRHAAARHDRHGPVVRARRADRRRADHGARRHHPGADPATDQGYPGRDRHGSGDDHPRSRRRRRNCRPGGGDVWRQGHGDRPRRGDLRGTAASLHQGAAQQHAGADRRQAAACRNPGRFAQPLAPAGRVPLPPALPACRGGVPGGGAPPGDPRHRKAGRMYQGRLMAPALELRQISKRFTLRGGGGEHVAVDRVDLVLPHNQVVALVGESGSGKTTTGLLALRLLASSAGQILLEGEDITALDAKALKPYRRRMQVVFQDSYASLDPMMTLGEIIAEPLGIHGLFTAAERRDHARRWLEKVGLDASYAIRYPHELSGGQRQRVSVARALILGASVLVADEPTSALDVSVKAQIVNLLQGLQADMGLSMLFISHDLSVVRSLADEVVVMLRGRVVERAPTDRIFSNARHPYTQSLLDAVPVIDPAARRRRTFLSAEEITARTPRITASDLVAEPLLDTADPQLVALAGSHFVEAIVAERATP